MCKFFLTFFLCFSVTIVVAQEYHVLQVRGQVKSSSGVFVKMHDVLKANEKLSFASPHDAVAVVSPKAGRFIIKPGESKSDSELVAYVKNAITPGIKKLSTRSGVVTNLVDLQTYFAGQLVLLDVLKLRVNQANFPLSSSSFFFIRYRWNNEEINKKLDYSGDTVLVRRSSLFKVDGKSIDPSSVEQLQLFFMNDNKVQLISSVDFVLPDLEQLKTEAAKLFSLRGIKGVEKSEEMQAYLNDFYGKIDGLNVRDWLAGL